MQHVKKTKFSKVNSLIIKTQGTAANKRLVVTPGVNCRNSANRLMTEKTTKLGNVECQNVAG
jgi:hypothetical protein